jgi:hypothetical protein
MFPWSSIEMLCRFGRCKIPDRGGKRQAMDRRWRRKTEPAAKTLEKFSPLAYCDSSMSLQRTLPPSHSRADRSMPKEKSCRLQH